MEANSKVGIVNCSNPQKKSASESLAYLDVILKDMGLLPVYSTCIYENEDFPFSGSARERAEVLHQFYRDAEIKAIFDISGGDIANEVLPYLDFSCIEKSGKEFWGYSDLTTILNAIYTRTGKSSVLYQIRNLIHNFSGTQLEDFTASIIENKNDLFDFQYEFIQGDQLSGIVVGGNLRCLLKLAGTAYWPPMEDRILFLESYGGGVPQIVTYLAQLKQLGVLKKSREFY